MKESITIQDAIDLLNDALKDDPKAIQQLVEARVECNHQLADHKTIQVANYHLEKDKFQVGLLGIINGMFGIDEKGYGPVTAFIEDDGTIIRFERTKHK